MERDDIMLWVANEEGYYNRVMRLYDRWVGEGDAWDESSAEKEAEVVIKQIAHELEEAHFLPQGRGSYSRPEISAAVAEVLEDFESYKDEAIASAVQQAQRKPKPEELTMDAGEIIYTKKMEEMLQKMQKLGRYDLEMLRGYMPVSQQKIRQALERGDKHLNSIALRKWDEQAEMLGRPWVGFSLSDGVGILKHVAKWHYA